MSDVTKTVSNVRHVTQTPYLIFVYVVYNKPARLSWRPATIFVHISTSTGAPYLQSSCLLDSPRLSAQPGRQPTTFCSAWQCDRRGSTTFCWKKLGKILIKVHHGLCYCPVVDLPLGESSSNKFQVSLFKIITNEKEVEQM